MKNRMQDVRNHLVAAMEALGDNDVSDAVIARARSRWRGRGMMRLAACTLIADQGGPFG